MKRYIFVYNPPRTAEMSCSKEKRKNKTKGKNGRKENQYLKVDLDREGCMPDVGRRVVEERKASLLEKAGKSIGCRGTCRLEAAMEM